MLHLWRPECSKQINTVSCLICLAQSDLLLNLSHGKVLDIISALLSEIVQCPPFGLKLGLEKCNKLLSECTVSYINNFGVVPANTFCCCSSKSVFLAAISIQKYTNRVLENTQNKLNTSQKMLADEEK